MTMYTVTQRFEISYGHRLKDYNGRCRNLHGHNAVITVHVAAPELDAGGMALDFTRIKETVKKWLDAELDHKTILQKSDPLAALLAGAGEPIATVDFPPTAENLARLVYENASSLGINVYMVEFRETEKSCATYRKDD